MASELRLLFSTDASGTASVRLQPVGLDGPQKPRAHTLDFALDQDDDKDLKWYLEEYMDLPDHGSRVRAHGIEERIDAWGRRLFEAVFGSGSQQKLMEALLATDGPRLLTVATDDAAVLRLPWEMLTNSTSPLFRKVTLRRQLEDAREAQPVQVELPLRILLVVSRPDDLGFIDPRMTTRGLLKALRPLGADNVAVDFCRPPTLAQLTTMLDDARADGKPYAIVHFDGHGTYDPLLHLGRLCFEQANATSGPVGTDPVTATRLGDLLAAYHIPLVILEACRSGQLDVQALRGVAPRLLDAGVGSVIAMSHAVHVEAARVLLERVYRELVKGRTIGQSLDLGRASLVAQPHRWIELGPGGRTVELHDWFLPQLYQRGNDTPLVPEGGGTRAEGQGLTVPRPLNPWPLTRNP
jgi:hypothetical protein